MKKLEPLQIALVAAGLLASQVSYAYVDPGTGSLIIQWLFGMAVAGFAFVNLYWHRLKQFLAQKTARDSSGQAEEPFNESGKE